MRGWLKRAFWVVVGVVCGIISTIKRITAQEVPTITPQAPPGVGSALVKLAGWIFWIFILVGMVSVGYGVVKLYSGDRRAGLMYTIGGIVAIIVSLNINSLVSSLTS